MQAQVEEQAQQYRRNYLLCHGVKEEKGEYTDSIIIYAVKEEIDIEILPNNLEWSRRRQNLRHIFKNKKLLKGKGVSITENLTKDHRMTKLNKARETYDFGNVWTSDGKIFFNDEKYHSRKPLVYYD